MRASVTSLSKKLISTFFAATLALGLVPAAAFAVEDSDVMSQDSEFVEANSDMQAEAEASVNGDNLDEDTMSDESSPDDVISTEPSDSEASGEISSPNDGDGDLLISAVTERINEDMALTTRTVAQAESTRSYFLAQTLESTRTIPVVSANLPLDTGMAEEVVEPVEGEGDGPSSQEEESDDGGDDPDSDDSVGASFTLAPYEGDSAVSAESTVIGSFTQNGITYAVEPGGESVAVVAADYTKLPEEFIENQVIVLPSMVTSDGLDYYTVSRIADYAFAGIDRETAATDAADRSESADADSQDMSKDEPWTYGSGSDDPEDAASESGDADPAEDETVGITAITIPASVTSIGDDAFAGFDTLQHIIVSEDNPAYSMYDGALYDADRTSLLLIPEGRLGAVRIAPSVTSIDPEVFSHCPSVDTLVADPDSAAYQLLEEIDFYSTNKKEIALIASDATNAQALDFYQFDATSFERENSFLESELTLSAKEVEFANAPPNHNSNVWVYSKDTVYWCFNRTFYEYNPLGVQLGSDKSTSSSAYEAMNQSYICLNNRRTSDGSYAVWTSGAAASGGSYPVLILGSKENFHNEYGGGEDAAGLRLNHVIHISSTFAAPTALGEDYKDWTSSTGTLRFWIDGHTIGNTGTQISEFYCPGDGGWKYHDDGKKINTQAKTVNHAGNLVGSSSVDVTVEAAPTIAPAVNKAFVGWECQDDGKIYQPGDVIYGSTNWLHFEAVWSDPFEINWDANTFGGDSALVNRDESYTYAHPDNLLTNDAPAGTVSEQTKITDISNQSHLKASTTIPMVIDPVSSAFLGWTANADGTPSKWAFETEKDAYYASDEGNNLYLKSASDANPTNLIVDKNMTLYAVWVYDVTFDPVMEGKDSVKLSECANLEDYIEYQAPFKQSLPEGILHEDANGYRFEGYWDEDGTQWFDKNGDPVPNLKWDHREPVTLTARWTYDVYFDTNTDDPASVIYGAAPAVISEAVPLSAGTTGVTYTLASTDSYGNKYYTGKENGRERAKVAAWKGAPITLPVATKRSGYEATQDWGTASNAVHSARIPYATTTGLTTDPLSESVAPNALGELAYACVLYAIWDGDPETGEGGHANTYFAKLVDATGYDQSGTTMAVDPSKVTAASPSVLRAKYDAPLVSMVNLGAGSLTAPRYKDDALVFDGYYAKVGDEKVWLTGGADKNGHVLANDALWRIAPVKQDDGSWIDEVTGSSIEVQSATYDGKAVSAVLLYAAWSLPIRNIEFNVNLDALDGVKLAAIPNVQINVDALPSKLDASHVLSDPAGDYTFAGWFDHPVHGNKYYDANGDAVNPGATWPSHTDTVLYAHWTYELVLAENIDAAHAGTDTVRLASGAPILNDKGEAKTFTEDVSANTLSTTLTKGEKVTLYDAAVYDTPEKVATLAFRMRTIDGATSETGYAFRGYFATDAWANTSVSYSSEYDYSGLNSGGRTIVYMGWEAKTTPLIYVETWTDTDGTTLAPERAGDHSGNTSIAYDAMLAQRSDEQLPYIPGWKFIGYYVHRDDGRTQVRYLKGKGSGQPERTWAETTQTVTPDVTGAVTLYAHYEQRHFAVSTDMEGGQGANPSFREVVYGQALPSGPYLPTRTGYEFLGWYYCADEHEADHAFPCGKCVMFYDENGKNTSSDCQKTWNIDGDGTLHAAWKARTYTIDWAYNYRGANPTAFAQTTQAYDAEIALPGTPKRPGYSFVGWSTEADADAGDAVTASSVLGDAAHPVPVSGTTLVYYAVWGDPEAYLIELDAGVGGWFVATDSRIYDRIAGMGATSRSYDISLDADCVNPAQDHNVSERLSDHAAYEFLGWKEDLTDKPEDFEAIPEDSLRNNVIPVNTGDVHRLVAQWKVTLFETDFFAYDPDVEKGDSALNDKLREDARIYANGSATKPLAGSELSWYYGASPVEGANISCTESTAFPVPRMQGYEFLGWYERGGDPESASKELSIDVSHPSATAKSYVARFAPISYTIHFFVSEGEQEDAVISAPYDTEIPLPGMAARNSLTNATADAVSNTTTSEDAYVYQGWWDVALHDLVYDEHYEWTPGAEVLVNDILAAPGIVVYAAEGESEPTHVNLYAQHRHGFSFTVPLRAAIMVAVDDEDAPIQVAAGSIVANSESGLSYCVEAVICDPVAGDGSTANANPGTSYVFTDESGTERAEATRLTLRDARYDDTEAIPVPLHETTVLYAKDSDALSGFTFKKGTPLDLEYGLLFPEGMTAVDFKSHLPKEGDTSVSYPIARLYYTIGFAAK